MVGVFRWDWFVCFVVWEWQVVSFALKWLSLLYDCRLLSEGVYDSSMDSAAYAGQIFQPLPPPGTMEYTAAGDGYEEEPPLLEGRGYTQLHHYTLTFLSSTVLYLKKDKIK